MGLRAWGSGGRFYRHAPDIRRVPYLFLTKTPSSTSETLAGSVVWLVWHALGVAVAPLFPSCCAIGCFDLVRAGARWAVLRYGPFNPP